MDRERKVRDRQWKKRQTERKRERKKERKKQIDREKKRHIEKMREAENQGNWKTVRLKGRQTDRQSYIETEKRDRDI